MDCVKIYGIMVIYNKCLKDSDAYNCLMKRDMKLIVCDNSSSDFGNARIAEQDLVHYVSMGGNQGLSKAYNRGLDVIFSQYRPENTDYICLFDDDTMISDNYFEELEKCRGRIILPVVSDGIGIMSPVFMPGRVAKRFSAIEDALKADTDKVSGINSSMAVQAGIFENYRYNEEMFLDYIDHMFIMDMRERKVFPEILNVTIRQNFSAVNDSKEGAIRRFRMQKKDLKIFYRKHPLLYLMVVWKKHIKLVVKYKDIKMIFC